MNVFLVGVASHPAQLTRFPFRDSCFTFCLTTGIAMIGVAVMMLLRSRKVANLKVWIRNLPDIP